MNEEEEFEFRARLERESAKPVAPVVAEKKPPLVAIGDAIPQVGAAETGAALVSGAAATPIAGLTGIGTAIAKSLGLTDADPSDVINKVMSAFTYQPQAESAKSALNAIGYVPAKIADASNFVGEKTADVTGSPVVGAAVNTGLQMLGPSVAAKGAGAVARAASEKLKSGARGVMQSALKPNQAELRTGKGQQAVQTLLDEGLNVSDAGVNALRERVTDINSKIATAIDGSPAVVNKRLVASRLQDALDKFEKQVTPTSDLAAIQKAHDEFMNHPMLDKITPAKTVETGVLDASGKPITRVIPASGSENIPVKTAQEIKQGTYKSLGGKAYGELKGAEIEAQKVLARSLKEEIAAAVPEVQPLNAAESKLLNALSVTERRVLVSANNNPDGLAWLTTDPAKFAGFMASRTNMFKSIVARMLNQTGELIPASFDTPARAAALTAESEQQRRQSQRK